MCAVQLVQYIHIRCTVYMDGANNMFYASAICMQFAHCTK